MRLCWVGGCAAQVGRAVAAAALGETAAGEQGGFAAEARAVCCCCWGLRPWLLLRFRTGSRERAGPVVGEPDEPRVRGASGVEARGGFGVEEQAEPPVRGAVAVGEQDEPRVRGGSGVGVQDGFLDARRCWVGLDAGCCLAGRVRDAFRASDAGCCQAGRGRDVFLDAHRC